jgi:tetratricopeptide (TPR) repeat protein
MKNDRPMNPLYVRQFAATARRLVQEREVASRIVEPLLRRTAPEKWPTLVGNAELHTAGALERLAALFVDKLGKQPLEARIIAELAVSIAEGLSPTAYPSVILAQLQAHAWKDHGKALRTLGKNNEALESFRVAEEKVSTLPLAHDQAIVRFNRAVSLQEMERFDESRALLTECRAVFREHGDSRNEILCGFAEGVLLQRMGRFRAAREVYLLLLASMGNIDTESRAAMHQGIGFCSTELGAFTDADVNLESAIALYQQVGMPMLVLKAELFRGRLLIRRGEVQKAIDQLRPVRREFLRHGMYEEAGISGLEIVEGFLRLERMSEAETLARKIVREFTLAGLSSRAVTALAYLSEAIAARKAKPSLVSEVREYILSLRWRPEREFKAS